MIDVIDNDSCSGRAVCKSCLVQHLGSKNTCPTCDIVIHQSHPLNYISYDRTMQDIVYKLAPHLQESKCANNVPCDMTILVSF